MRTLSTKGASTCWLIGLLTLSLVAGTVRLGRAAVEPGPDDADAPKEFAQTDSGLQYRVLHKSDRRKPTAKDTVTVHYKGWLDSGKEFDSSYKRGEPTTFPLGNVIPGWTEGMQLVGEGGKIELLIPSNLGYGKKGFPGAIPPDATLHFIVELKKIQ
jgi:FKBP-type peptidyl-prolyl cis-trans isomerase FkpA